MNKNICITVFVLVLCLAVASTAGFVYYNYDYAANEYKSRIQELEGGYGELKEAYEELNSDYNKLIGGKKAVIILPGIMGSVLCDDQLENKPLYSDIIEIMAILLQLYDTSIEDYLRSALSCDEEGNVLRPMTPCSMDSDEKYRDGMLGLYKPLRKKLESVCSDTYDVITWQYDWRQSNSINGAKLEDFIVTNGYSKVILVAHSMGGQVVSNFLQKKSNRKMVELFVPIAVPFLGSFGAEDALYQPSYKPSTGVSYIDNVNLDFAPLIGNMASVYELLPSYSGEFGVETHISDGKTLAASELSSLYAGFPKTIGSDGASKGVMTSFDSYNARMYADIVGAKVHVSRLVNTEYLVYTGYGTSLGAIYEGGKRTRTIYGDGDGTVWSYSASAGLPLDSSNVTVLNRVGHGDVSSGYVLNAVAGLVERYITIYNN